MDHNPAEFGGTLDLFSAEGQVKASRNTPLHIAAVDIVGICDFFQRGFGAGLEVVSKMVSAKLGKPFREEDDRLHRMFYEEQLPPHNKVVIIPE